ncbi:MAG: hypothetical protein ACK4OF_00755 [Aquificaceae bacterium]
MVKSLLFLHIFFAVVWIGGMIYSVFFLKPSLKEILQEEVRTRFLRSVLLRFFMAVWASMVVLFLTGMGLWHGYRRDFSENTLFHTKIFLFGLMTLLFLYIYFFLYKKNRLSHIPNLIGINLFMGILILLIIIYIK